jgi:autotransporter-associated beta strand protein
MSKKLNLSSALGILLIGILLGSISEGLSQTTNYFTWNNTTNTWSTTTAWTPNGGPQSSSATGNTNVAVFAATGAGNNTVLLGSDRTVFGLIFTNGANAYTLGSVSTPRQLDIMSGIGLQNVSGQNQIFNLSVANNGTGLWTNSAASTTTFNNGLNLTTASSTANRTLTLGGAGTWNVASAIANGGNATAGAVTVTATGTTTLSGNNTYDGLTTMNAAGGTLTLSGDNSGAGGGVTLTAGTLNINNNNALGTGALSLAGTGATINNTSGAAVVNAGNQAWTWSDGLAFGSSTNTAANNLNLGTGVVTASSTRTIALAGSGTKLTIGAVNITSTSSGRTITVNGAGNTLEMGGLTLSASVTPVTVTLAGTANLGVTGAIVNGTTPGNGLTVTATGTTTFSGNNTYTGLTTMNAAGGTLTLSGDNSAASGGVTLTAGTLNINNNNALGGGALSLAGTGATINNTSGAAVVNAGNQAWALADGLAFGSATNTAANNLNLGTGVVTVAGNRTIALAGTGTKLTIGAVNITSTSSGRTITANGAGNILEMGGLTLSASATPVTVTLAGTANLGVTGAIVNGTTPGNGLTVTATGTTTFSGNNTYTGVTTISAGTTILSGNNSSATGGLVVAGASATTDKPVLRLNSANAISSGSTISGASSSDRVGTLDFNASTAYTLNSYSGGTMNFVNSFGQDSVVTFTSAANILTSSAGSTGGRSLQNNSANLDIVFNGSLDIGSSVTDTVNTIGGAGDFVVKGNIFSTTVGSVRGLNKTGAGLLEMRGDNNSYNGSTSIFNGTISVTNGAVLTGTTVRVAPSIGNSGTLLVNGTAGAVVVSARGILAGGGTVGDVKLENGSFLKPGNSPGLLTAASSTWAAGSTYNWEIDNATGTAGTNWDVFSVTGALDLSALSSNAKMNLVLESLSIANFSTSTVYDNWVIAQAGSFIGTGLADGTDVTSLFNINTAAFNGGAASNLPNGGFQVLTGTEGSLRTLTLMAVPEPSTGSMFGLGLAGLVATRLFRRKSS